jgi:hypothetical protein
MAIVYYSRAIFSQGAGKRSPNKTNTTHREKTSLGEKKKELGAFV